MDNVGPVLLVGFFAWLGWKMLKGFDAQHSEPMFCTRCGHEGDSKTKTRGSLLIEVVLWLCFIVPGLVYSLWRHSSRQPVCAKCGSDALIPPDTPAAMAQKRNMNA